MLFLEGDDKTCKSGERIEIYSMGEKGKEERKGAGESNNGWK